MTFDGGSKVIRKYCVWKRESLGTRLLLLIMYSLVSIIRGSTVLSCLFPPLKAAADVKEEVKECMLPPRKITKLTKTREEFTVKVRLSFKTLTKCR